MPFLLVQPAAEPIFAARKKYPAFSAGVKAEKRRILSGIESGYTAGPIFRFRHFSLPDTLLMSVIRKQCMLKASAKFDALKPYAGVFKKLLHKDGANGKNSITAL